MGRAFSLRLDGCVIVMLIIASLISSSSHHHHCRHHWCMHHHPQIRTNSWITDMLPLRMASNDDST